MVIAFRTHFKHENGSTFNPFAFNPSLNPFANLRDNEEYWQEFPIAVHVIRKFKILKVKYLKASVTPSKIQTINTLSEATSDMQNGYCLCLVDDFSALVTFLKSHPIYLISIYLISGVLFITGLIIIMLKFCLKSRPE